MITERAIVSQKTKTRISGHVYSLGGATLKGAKVVCNGVETTTLADGFYVITGITPGTYVVRVSLQGFQSIGKNISLQEEETVLDFYLPEAKGTAKIHGHVYNESKKPLTHGTIILVLPVTNKYTQIDAEGHYEFRDLPADTYTIATSIPGYEDCTAVLTVAEGEIKTCDFTCKSRRVEEPPWG
ncbi:MAG: carboxypeptidase-like regulatory domain-containing protein [Candidatus Bathyarchaeia archaeon]